jgi:ribosomal-protein-alanine N-acetyltransferase
MDAPCRIRDATPADAPRLAELERECFPDPWSEAGIEEVLRHAVGICVVTEVAGVVQGYVLARAVADEAEILNVAVAPAWRRHGAARAMLQQVLTALRGRGVAEVFLEVRQSNVAARSLYRDLGFRVAGMRPAYYRRPVEDALVLRRAFNESA